MRFLLILGSVLFAGIVPAAEIDPRLEPLRPLTGKTWQGKMKSPDGKMEFPVTQKFELTSEGKVIRISRENGELGSSEGFIYWDDTAKSICFFIIEKSGVFQSGTVTPEGNTVTFRGRMTWPAPPPNPGIRQSFDFRNTFELLSDSEIRDSWFQNAFGPWRPGHVIEFRAVPRESGFADITPIVIAFETIPGAGDNHERTIKSVKRIRDISEQYATGGLYLITHYGDRTELFEAENRELLKNNWIGQPWRFCTIFATGKGSSQVIGRNWDNQNVGSVIVSYYKPAKGYASVSFSRAIDIGLPVNIKIDEIAATPFGDKLPLAPFYSYDGVNDRGLFAAVTGIATIKTNPAPGKRRTFISYIVRKILDNCRSIEEALRLVEELAPFDLDGNSLSCHFFIADNSGRSVVLEYATGQWRNITPEKSWQILTNRIMLNVSENVLREKCARYKITADFLESNSGRIDTSSGLQLLKDVSQAGTTWSAVYLPHAGEIIFSVYQDWKRIYRLQLPGEKPH